MKIHHNKKLLLCNCRILSAQVEGATGYGSLGKISIGVKKIKVIGTCCLKIYEKETYQGISQSIPVGFEGAPNFPNIRSIKFGHCNAVVNHLEKRSADPEPSAQPEDSLSEEVADAEAESSAEPEGDGDAEAEVNHDLAKRSAEPLVEPEADAEADAEVEPEDEAEAEAEAH